MEVSDMVKIYSPFVRPGCEGTAICGRKLENPTKQDYYVTPEITPGYEWVFKDPRTITVEKLDGTNGSPLIQHGVITGIWNRTERVPFFNKGKRWFIDAFLNSYERGYMNFLEDGQHFGEVIGPKVRSNPYGLDEHLWLPFKQYCNKNLAYESWGKYPKTFESISEWLKDLMPLYMSRLGKGKEGYVEGVIFVHPDGRMAKLRRNMFSWWEEQCKTR